MAKAKKTTRSKKPTAKVQDMAPKKSPKGGALNAYLKYNTIKIESTPTTDISSLNFNKVLK